MHFEADLIEKDSFIVTPAIVLTLARCQGCGNSAALLISFDWLIWHLGLVIPLPHSH